MMKTEEVEMDGRGNGGGDGDGLRRERWWR